MIVDTLALFILGLAFGSFVNALVWRIHKQAASRRKKPDAKLSIVKGRSMCSRCGHELSAADLVPVLSWLWLRGRCRYCKKPIDDNPLVEVACGVIFILLYLLWPQPLGGSGEKFELIIWLICSVGLLALAVYDLRWTLLPNRILYPTAAVAWIGQLATIVLFNSDKLHRLLLFAASVAVASGIFWLIFELNPNWIGFGDVRLGLVTGALLASPLHSVLMIFVASLLGTLVAVPALLMKKKSLASRIPFGPYLIAAAWLVQLFGTKLIHAYRHFTGI